MAANLKNDRMVVTNMPTKEMGMLYTIKYLPDEVHRGGTGTAYGPMLTLAHRPWPSSECD